ncbi:hypothetical protein [Natronorubrum halophilum]|uniref:hypothetical protein n=1 Tax=Natronorubrum halophilum TaxID=1702106 RepID=UPI0010C1AE62|nr:hypothetical protein [Natronorubrum halophilum]
MVTDSIRDRRERDRSLESNRRDRGQVILVGAIALAFVILGVVVVFNGVLYTETLSSGSTSQSASTADATELEIERGVGCLLVQLEEGNATERQVEENVSVFTDRYQRAQAQSSPTAVDISVVDVNGDFSDPTESHSVTVTITVDSYDLSYEQERTIEAHCRP